jgi:hypothetical protein
MVKSGVMGCLIVMATVGGVWAADPWADSVVGYSPGTTAQVGYTTPTVSIGSPERYTGENVFGGAFASPVTMFNPAYGDDEIVSVGEGGQLTLRFDEPVTNDPSHLYGVDLIVFSNSGFVDFGFPAGQHGSPTILFGSNFGVASLEVSADGVNFFPVAARADSMFPSEGWLDVALPSLAPTPPGTIPTNFLRPVNPLLTAADFAGLSYTQSLTLYDGSGGGMPVDIDSSGLGAISYVRISVADDGNTGTSRHVEIDGLAAVPEPATFGLVMAAVAIASRRRRRTLA